MSGKQINIKEFQKDVGRMMEEEALRDRNTNRKARRRIARKLAKEELRKQGENEIDAE